MRVISSRVLSGGHPSAAASTATNSSKSFRFDWPTSAMMVRLRIRSSRCTMHSSDAMNSISRCVYSGSESSGGQAPRS